MKSKSIFKSKFFYLGLMQIVAGVAELLKGETVAGLFAIVTGVATIVLRKYFTNTAIK